MSDEAPIGSAGRTDGGGHSGRSRGEPAPLQSRAKFLQNWDWSSVAKINSGLCERGKAQRGINSETHAAVAEEWEKSRAAELTLLETLRFLKSCHRRAPFLFFNGNTFAEIGRALANVLFSDLPFHRRKEASSAAAHFVTGVLDEPLMIAAVNALGIAASFAPGDRVTTLRGSTRGVIVRLENDGRVVWRPDRAESDLSTLPESLLREPPRKKRTA
jgi:hypothetical protein